MNEIKYDGNFEEDINNIKEPITIKEKINKFFSKHSKFFMNLVTLSFISIGIINIHNIISGTLILPSILELIGVVSFSIITKNGFNKIRTIKQSEKALLNLRKQLSKNHGISISKKNLQQTHEITTKIMNKNTKEEKIIKYFELLDRDDQIRVLKSIRYNLVNDVNQKNELFILDKEDYKLENIKITRRLKR